MAPGTMVPYHGRNDAVRLRGIRAVLFDTFGTIVDWRGSLIAQCTAIGERRGIEADWRLVVDQWLAAYRPSLDQIRSGRREWANLDDLQRISLSGIVERQGIAGVTADALREIGDSWARLDPWPDSVACLAALKASYVIGPLSNGNTALLVAMAKHSRLPWDVVMGADVWRRYKPDADAYLSICRYLDLPPETVMMAAAHNADLAAAAAAGLSTGFIPRPTEFGPDQRQDLVAERAWTVVGDSLPDFVSLMTA